MKCNALVIAITLLGTLGKVPLAEASTCTNCNTEKTVNDCDGICMEGTDFCNICVKSTDDFHTYAESIGISINEESRLISPEELSQILVWSNNFDDPLKSNVNRVDGVFFDGSFKSSLTGDEINFRHFPTFDDSKAMDGDTLVYLQDSNILQIVPPTAKYRALLVFPKVGDKSACPSNNRFVCNGGGSCIDNTCVCDPWSTGTNCKDVKRCPNNCNGFGTCELETGTCFCPGFKGANCEFCQSGIRYLNAEETMFDCFTLSHEPMTFKEAVVYCGNKGLPLAKIDTELDHMNVIDKLKDMAEWVGKDHIFGWLGATNMDCPGVMLWFSNDVFEAVNNDNSDTTKYVNWKAGEPSETDYNDDDDCLSIKSDTMQWHDTSCHRRNYAICQYRGTKTT